MTPSDDTNNPVQPDDMLKDNDFIQYMHAEYLKQKRIKKAQEAINNMASEMKCLTKAQVIEKYGNPSRTWALLQWELIKAKKGLHDEFDSK